MHSFLKQMFLYKTMIHLPCQISSVLTCQHKNLIHLVLCNISFIPFKNYFIFINLYPEATLSFIAPYSCFFHIHQNGKIIFEMRLNCNLVCKDTVTSTTYRVYFCSKCFKIKCIAFSFLWFASSYFFLLNEIDKWDFYAICMWACVW